MNKYVRTPDYSKITEEQFSGEVYEQACQLGSDYLLSEIPGVYELVAEFLNNDVLDALAPKENEDD